MERPPEGLRGKPSGLAETPARVLAGRAGLAYRTAMHLELRFDHAAARDAVWEEIDLLRDFGQEFLERWRLFEVGTEAATKAEFLLRPDKGRRLTAVARTEIAKRCPCGADLQVVLGDGLSATALKSQAPPLLMLLARDAAARGLNFGQPFFVRHCRVGVLNDVGEVLSPGAVILLIGERPGLATAESLSSYMAWRPRSGHTDADRNLVSNIHGRGVDHQSAARRILALSAAFRHEGRSGFAVKEDLAALLMAKVPAPRLSEGSG